MIYEEVEEHIEEHQEMLTNKDLVKSSTEEEEEIEVEPAMWTLKKLGEVFQMAQNFKEKLMDYDPMMKHGIKFTRMITAAVQPLQLMFNELKRQKQQLPITMFFHKVKKIKASTIIDPQPSTSSSHLRFRLLSLLHLLKKTILMNLLPLHQKVNGQAQRHNAYTNTPLHPLIIGIVLSSYHHTTTIVVVIISDHCSNKKIGEVGEYPQLAKIFFNK